MLKFRARQGHWPAAFALLLGFGLGASGCFVTSFSDGQYACGSADECPAGLRCDPVDQRCRALGSPGPDQGSRRDAPSDDDAPVADPDVDRGLDSAADTSLADSVGLTDLPGSPDLDASLVRDLSDQAVTDMPGTPDTGPDVFIRDTGDDVVTDGGFRCGDTSVTSCGACKGAEQPCITCDLNGATTAFCAAPGATCRELAPVDFQQSCKCNEGLATCPAGFQTCHPSGGANSFCHTCGEPQSDGEQCQTGGFCSGGECL